MNTIWKRVLAAALAVLLIVGTAAASGSVICADETPEILQCGANVECVIYPSAKLMVLRGSGDMWNISLCGYMWYADKAQTLIIEEGITRIGSNAFSLMHSLQYASIPQSMRSIGEYAFYNCRNLKCITIPDSVTELGADAFLSCGSLEHAVLSSRLTKIEDETFSRCSSLRELHVPYGVTTMGILAFAHCTSMEYVHIPSSVKTFNDCTFLTDSPAYICSDSAKSEVKRIADMMGITFRVCSGHTDSHTHSYSTFVTKQPSCSQEGSQTEICTICGCSNTKFIAKTEHTRKEEVTSATCTTAGFRRVVCTTCGATLEETVLPALDHNYNNGAVTRAATCTNEGVRTFTCLRCGESYTETIDKLPHTPQVVTEPATCKTEGRQYTKCAVCGEPLSAVTTLPKTDHTPADAVRENEKTATCTQGGSFDAVIRCRDCGKELSRTKQTTEKLGHSFTNYVYNCDATREHDGTKTAKCDRCSETDTIPAPGTIIISSIAIRNYQESKTVDYRTTITFKADVTKPVSGGTVIWFVDGQKSSTGETIDVKDAKKSYTVQAKYMRGSEELAASGIEKINVNTGFFARLKAFFRALFGKLPKEVQAAYEVGYHLNLLP